MIAKSHYWVLFLALQSFASVVFTQIETFKMPAGHEVIEVMVGKEKEVSFGLRNIPDEEKGEYLLQLKYGRSQIRPGINVNLDHLLTLDTENCISREGTTCKELEVSLNGEPSQNNTRISLVVYKKRSMLGLVIPHDVTASYTKQEYIIRIVDPSSSTVPTTLPVHTTPNTGPETPPVSCPPVQSMMAAPDTMVGLSRDGGNAVFGVLLMATFLTLLAGNFVFMGLWCTSKTRK